MPSPRKSYTLSVRGLWLGYQMRQLRNESGLTLQDVAGYAGMDHATLARLERSEYPWRPDQVAVLLNLYGVHEEDVRAALANLARDSGCLNWWRLDPRPQKSSGPLAALTHSPVGQARMSRPPSLEWLYEQATEVAVYAPVTVPELFQTRAYAFAVAEQSADPAEAPHWPHRQVEVLSQRWERLSRRGVRLIAVIDGLVLHRPIGGVGTLASQLDYLRDLTRPNASGNATVRVLATDQDRQLASHGPFTVLRLGANVAPVAVIEHLGGHMLLEGPWAAGYVAVFDRLADAALNRAASHAAILERAHDLAHPAAAPTTPETSGIGPTGTDGSTPIVATTAGLPGGDL